MSELDDTDVRILRLLLDDARQSYTDIGEQVDLSAPTVSNRVSRLEELGVIQGFTLDIDRSMLRVGDAVLIEIRTEPGETDALVASLTEIDAVEYVVQSFEPRVTVHAFMDDQELEALVTETLDAASVESYEIRKVSHSVWDPGIDHADLAMECVQCGKPIRGDGVSVTVEKRRYYLCCTSCESAFKEEYETLRTAAGDG
ncbi:winged helix-turn-helix transcriptional regulator [Haloarcula onubensis]|uniref:Winged helix-turn-helix transcriptional regulator n=1 Tax=Haloarcula onubensis TaxID=2950539 RepID=A0ABU2FPJ4_9EURY|nr:winged helix-turn-helix transcriptional regulator [Halomicroarcula sp. S3CR25-11]MDS0282674.1 winged helix-turn-helix transcriptional regulator [Halomicroarcula sp. S3CR25-11]